jgi:hypothetical protein
MHEQSRTVATPLKDLDFDKLIPGGQAMADLQKTMR